MQVMKHTPIDVDAPTPHRKGSQKVTPRKADHQHEYVRGFTMMYLRRFDNTLSTEKYKFTTPVKCIVCGHAPARHRGRDIVEVEISPKEYRALKS